MSAWGVLSEDFAHERDAELQAELDRRRRGLDVRQLAAMVEATSPDAREVFERGLDHALYEFLHRTAIARGAGTKALKSELRSIEAQARAFGAALESVSEEAWLAMSHFAEEAACHSDEEDRFQSVDWSCIPASSAELAHAADVSAQFLPMSKGRRADHAFNGLVRSLAALFEQNGTLQAAEKVSYADGEPDSPFLSFLAEVVEGFCPEQRRRRVAMLEVLRRVTGKRSPRQR